MITDLTHPCPRGLIPPLVGVGVLNAIVFGTYSAAKRVMVGQQGGDTLSLAQITACGLFKNDDLAHYFWITFVLVTINIILTGSLAGLTSLVITTPVELLKCREQV